jgi:hypothetical protein
MMQATGFVTDKQGNFKRNSNWPNTPASAARLRDILKRQGTESSHISDLTNNHVWFLDPR